MFRSLLAALALAVALSFTVGAQSQSGRQPPSTKPQTTPPQAEKQQTVIVTGCVQRGAQPGSYVLTARQDPLAAETSRRLGGGIPTPTYQLGGTRNLLEGMVGHRVQVKGVTEAQPEKTVEVGKETTTTEPKAEGTSGKKPKVKTDTSAKVELRRLDVQSLTAVEGACEK